MIVFVNGVPRWVNSREARNVLLQNGVSYAHSREITLGVFTADTPAKKWVAAYILREYTQANIGPDEVSIYFPP